METSFNRVIIPNSSKPPITYRSKKHAVSVSQTGPISSGEAQEKMQALFRETTSHNKSSNNKENNYALNTSKNDVFILRGKDAQSATLTKQSCDELNQDKNAKKHNLVEVLLQPKKAKKRAAIYFDSTAMKGKKIAGLDVDKSQKGRVKIKIKTLDLMA